MKLGESVPFQGHTDCVNGVCFSPDGKTVASGSLDNSVRVWDATTGKLLRTLPADDADTCLAFAADGARLAVGRRREVTVWEIGPDSVTANTMVVVPESVSTADPSEPDSVGTSSFTILPVAFPSTTGTLAPERVTVSVSSGSGAVSPFTGTSAVLSVCPGSNVRSPEDDWKSDGSVAVRPRSA